ncbi:MAG: ATP-binding protein [Opitutus sp.]|nr:ATP-binding protein [Opitutus sp.]
MINQRQQLVGGALIPLLDFFQDEGDVVHGKVRSGLRSGGWFFRDALAQGDAQVGGFPVAVRHFFIGGNRHVQQQPAADVAQIEQLVINLVKNAVEAALEQRADGHADAGVRLRWRKTAGGVELSVEDDGPGIAQATNLFVPFFTTKPDGSGIGLVLCRQIAENHGGVLALTNRLKGSGCLATLRLPG